LLQLLAQAAHLLAGLPLPQVDETALVAFSGLGKTSLVELLLLLFLPCRALFASWIRAVKQKATVEDVVRCISLHCLLLLLQSAWFALMT
jgi:hypothetical protein